MRANLSFQYKTIESLAFAKQNGFVHRYDISLITNIRCDFDELS